jgi:hypothetical protein
MSNRGFAALALSTLLAAAGGPSVADDRGGPEAQPKRALVELYTSQGCDSCPPASDLLGGLARLGYGPDRVVAVNFHVDYFNDPWSDPYSDPEYSRRQLSYNQVQRRDDLYFTPLMMVDGRYPLLGSDRPKVLAALERALAEPAGVALDLALNGNGRRKTLSVAVAARSPSASGRDLLVGVALTEDPVTTAVTSGENAGRTLVEHHVVRRFAYRFTRPDPTGSRRLTFPLELGVGSNPERSRVAVFAQDRGNGTVYQADALPWSGNGRDR